MYFYIKRKTILHSAELTNQLIQNRFVKKRPTHWGQVVNPWHQGSQGQPVTKPETPLEYPSWYINMIQQSAIATIPFQYSQRRYEGRTLLGRYVIADTSVKSINSVSINSNVWYRSMKKINSSSGTWHTVPRKGRPPKATPFPISYTFQYLLYIAM